MDAAWKTEGSNHMAIKETEAYKELSEYLEQAMAYQTALVLLEWDNETLAPEQAGPYTARVEGTLSAAYQNVITDKRVMELIRECEKELGREDGDSSLVERAIIREAKEEAEQLSCIPPEEYRAFKELVSESARTWAKAKEDQDFDAFAPTLK